MVLVLLTFGDRLENHYQASFAILSYLKSKQINHVCVVTDRPEFYQYFGDKVDLIEINDSIMQEWRGEHDFFWRIKMKAIEAAAFKHQNQDILYVDSDTIYVQNLDKIKKNLDIGTAYMHEKEGKISQLPSKTISNMWKILNGNTYGSFTIDEQTEMWNAGVIAIPRQQALDVINYAIQLCDEMCATDCPRRLVEQFAFSLSLKEKLNLMPAEAEIAHYWGNKPEWNQKIVEFFMRSTLSGYTLEQDIKRFNPNKFISLPIIYKEKSTKDKLIKLLNRIMKPKEIRHF